MSPLISFITPVFNTESYLRQCIDSVFAQGIDGAEMILIDDGSTDRSHEIAMEMAANDSRIKVVQQANAGPGSARNRGLEMASGKYVFFIDSDDLLPNNGSIKELIDIAERNSCEIVCGLLESFNTSKKWIVPALVPFQNLRLFNVKIEQFPMLQHHVSPCGKLFQSDALRSHGGRFLEDCHWGEDAYFVLNAMRQSSGVGLMPGVTYRYRVRDSHAATSLTSIIRPELFDDLVKVTQRLDRDFNPVDTYETKKLRDVHFIRSFKYHFDRAIKHGFPVDVERRIYQCSQRFVQTVSDAALSIFEPQNNLVFELLRAGDFTSVSSLMGSRIDLGILNSIYASHKHGDGKVIIALSRLLLERERKAVSTTSKVVVKTAEKKTVQGKILAGPQARSKIALAKRKASYFYWSIRSFLGRVAGSALARLNDDIWLVGERGGDGIQDTGFKFFQWCTENHPEKSIYFVTKSRHVAQMPSIYRKKVLRYGSIRHFSYFFAAKVFAFNDSYRDLFFHWERLVRIQKQPKPKIAIFLQHGVIGLNKMHGYYDFANMIQRGQPADLFVVSSEREREFVCHGLGHPKKSVIVTGLSRFDSLPSQITEKFEAKNRLLFIPTWRNWLRWDTDKVFTSSDFFKILSSWLSDPRLEALLERHDLYMDIMMHHAFSKFLRHFDAVCCDRVNIKDMASCNVQQHLIDASLLVTDYSSVSLDFAYMGKPVVFLQFDVEGFLNARGGSFLNYSTDLPGPVVKTPEALEVEIERIVANGFNVESEYLVRADKFFSYRDKNNSKRIFERLEYELALRTEKSNRPQRSFRTVSGPVVGSKS